MSSGSLIVLSCPTPYNPRQLFPRCLLSTTTEQPQSTREKVQGVINLIRPAVQADGGDIELVDVLADGTVQIRFHGACHGCPSSTMTLQMGIERNLREKVPEITAVVPVA